MSNREIISVDTERQALLDRIQAAKDFANGDLAIGYAEFISGQEASAGNISRQMQAGHIDRQRYNEEYVTEVAYMGSVLVDAHELAPLAELTGLSREDIDHEWRHWRAAITAGFEEPRVGVIFLKLPHQTPRAFPVALMGRIPERMSDEAVIAGIQSVVQAPRDPSLSDIAHLPRN